jgi:hypothetical protein
MRGKLTVEKAASNMSVFLKAIDIVVNSPNGTIARNDFGFQMAQFINIPAIKDGLENRTPYNKSKFPRYFGFLDILLINDITHLKVTKRGLRLYALISDQGDDIDFEKRYFIAKDKVEKVSELFWESIMFDSFGRNNSGAEESFTDIDPVKLIIYSLVKLKSCTREELCFIIFGLNGSVNQNSHEFNSLDEAILKINDNRLNKFNNYNIYFEKIGKVNIVNDFKILNILSDQNVRVLLEEDNNFCIDKKYAYTYIEQIKSNYFFPFYQAKNELISYEENLNINNNWVREIRLGGVLDENIVVYDFRNQVRPLSVIDDEKGQFETALIKSFENPKTNIYLWAMNINEKFLEDNLGEAMNLLERVSDFTNNNNGFSINRLPLTHKLSIYLSSKSAKIKEKTKEFGGLYFPANFHLIIQYNIYEQI